MWVDIFYFCNLFLAPLKSRCLQMGWIFFDLSFFHVLIYVLLVHIDQNKIIAVSAHDHGFSQRALRALPDTSTKKIEERAHNVLALKSSNIDFFYKKVRYSYVISCSCQRCKQVGGSPTLFRRSVI